MKQITALTDSPIQSLIIVDELGNNFNLNLRWQDLTSSWYYDLIYSDSNFSLMGCKLVTNLNLLKQWKNILPFGLACLSSDGQDPFSQEDFANNRINLFTLTPTDLSDIKNIWNY